MAEDGEIDPDCADLIKQLLSCVTEGSEVKLVQEFIHVGGDVNATNNHKMTLLMAVSIVNSFDVMSMLLEHGANIFQRDKTRMNALMHASLRGNKAGVQVLLAACNLDEMKLGTALGARDKWGNSALALAARRGFTDVVELLLEAGARIDEPNKSRQTPLFQAVRRSHFSSIQLLVKAGADLERADIYGTTILSMAETEKRWDTEKTVHDYLVEMQEIPTFCHLPMRWVEKRYLNRLRKASTSEIQSILTNVVPPHCDLMHNASSLMRKALVYGQQHQHLNIYDPLYIATIVYVRTRILEKLIYHLDAGIIALILSFLPVRRD